MVSDEEEPPAKRLKLEMTELEVQETVQEATPCGILPASAETDSDTEVQADSGTPWETNEATASPAEAAAG